MLRLAAALALALPLGLAQATPQDRTAPAPRVGRAEILATYPHDTAAFTEGLLFHHGALYESTGESGRSTIRRVDLETGRVRASVAIPAPLFGEGIVAWNDRLFSVTWHGGRGFIWSLPGLERTGDFRYDGEGWAMTSDGDHLILSDGTPVLRFLDPQTREVARRVTVTWRGRPVRRVNELEYVEGEILANIWMTSLIARIDPETGKVVGWIDLSAIVAALDLADVDSVANGIAWDAAHRRLYVTGKNWPHLYRIALPPGIGQSGAGAVRPPADAP